MIKNNTLENCCQKRENKGPVKLDNLLPAYREELSRNDMTEKQKEEMSLRAIPSRKNWTRNHLKTGRVTHGIRRAFLKNPSVSAGAKTLLLLLFCYRGSDFVCWPSTRTLARNLNVARKTIWRWTEELKRAGYVKVERRGFNKSLSYKPSYIPQFKKQQPSTQNKPKSGASMTPKKEFPKKGSLGVKMTQAVVTWCPPTLSKSLTHNRGKKIKKPSKGKKTGRERVIETLKALSLKR